MSDEVLERKVRHIGTWLDDAVSDNIIRYINKVMEVEKGKKVILRMSKDGLRIFKSTALDGKSIHDLIPINCIHYVTVNQHNKVNMLVITQHRSRKFQILAFCCANAVDAGRFVQTFKVLKHVRPENSLPYKNLLQPRSAVSSGNTQNHIIYRSNFRRGTPNGGIPVNVTSKTVSSDVSPSDFKNESPTSIGHLKVTTEDIVELEEVEVSGETQHNVAIQTPNNETYETVSMASSLDLCKDIDELNSELRDVKFLLEKSSGIAADENGNDIDDVTNNEKKNFGTQTIQYRKRVINASEEDIPKRISDSSLDFSEWRKMAQSDNANSKENLFLNVNGKAAMNGVPESPKANAKVTFDPVVSSQHSRSNSVHSRRPRPLSTFIERPIETVYPKRASLKGSLVYRMGRANSLGRIHPNPFVTHRQINMNSADIKHQKPDAILKKPIIKTEETVNGNAHVVS